MLTKTQYTVNQNLLQEAMNQLPNDEFKMTLNSPNGNFFYDPWEIKDEYKNTVWAELLSSLKEPIGEARIIILKSTQGYHSHADIDDRFHLNIIGESCYLIDLDNQKLHKLETDGCWQYMDAGRLHTAVNFGRTTRVQLVVRKLLNKSRLFEKVHVRLVSNLPRLDDSRFVFDNTISPWLNKANKRRIIDNFSYSPTHVEFDIEKQFVSELEKLADSNFRIDK